MSRPTVDQASKQNIGEFGIHKFGCFDDVSKIFVLKKSAQYRKFIWSTYLQVGDGLADLET